MTLRQSSRFPTLVSCLGLLLVLCCAPGFCQSISQQTLPQQTLPQQTLTQPIPEIQSGGAEAWLVTYGPGEVYWERFGHNAIWLREPAAGIDHTFNFGFFDFEQEDFFLRFLRGKMMYFSVAQPAGRDFEFYQQQNRSIRLQKLSLNSTEYLELRDYLLNEIEPENRNYHYDYYLSNCSTRIRDALDLAFEGELSAATKNSPSEMNFRDQTRRLTQSQYWYYLGLEMGLGHPVDRQISRWEDMFIPMVVADEVSKLTRPSGSPMVSEDVQLYVSSLPQAKSNPTSVWLRYLLGGLLLAGLYWLAIRLLSPGWANRISISWVLLIGCGGLVLSFLWLFTDHSVTVNNANVLLLNPLFMLAVLPSLRRFSAVLLIAGVLISAILLLFPNHQYNIDILMMLAPLSLSVAIFWMRARNSSSHLATG